MHGIIFAELQKYVNTKVGPETWEKLLKESGLTNKVYLMSDSYPDKEAVDLVVTASKITKLPVEAILEDFGEFITPDLIKIYGAYIKPEWKTIDFLEHTEEYIHKALKLKDPQAKPPELVAKRANPREVTIFYNSQRKLCGVAKGIIKGVAKHYKENITLQEPTCMNKGGNRCELRVRVN